MIEAVALCERVADRQLEWTYVDQHRLGDHMWWISDLSRFRSDYPGWSLRHDLTRIVEEIFEANRDRWERGS